MSKPLTTLGEALMAKGGTGEMELDWRSQMRANGIERRAPPPSAQPMDALGRPDRGYVEQPEERVAPPMPRPAPTTTLFPPKSLMPDQIAPFMRRRTETPTLTAPVALIRFERHTEYPVAPEQPLKDEKEEQMQQPQEQPEPANVATQPASPATEGSDMPRKARKKRVDVPDNVRATTVDRILRGVIETGASITSQAEPIAKELGVAANTPIRWAIAYTEKNPRWRATVAAKMAREAQRAEAPEAAPSAPSRRTMAGPPKNWQRAPDAQEWRELAARRVISGDIRHREVSQLWGATESAVSNWISTYKQAHPDWDNPAAATKTLLSAPMSAPVASRTVSIPASINSGSLPPLPVITVAGVPNPAFGFTGLGEYIQAMVALGVKAELKRRLGDD